MSQPLLSICIPTYNRADILKENISLIQKQLADIDILELEIIVSNNCSKDHTEKVVSSFIEEGVPIVYNCNSKNLGADGNFLKAINLASGKYIYLLGDDDYLDDYVIKKLLDVLRYRECGLVYIDTQHANEDVDFFYNRTDFIKHVSYFYTFMSSCIFRKDAINNVYNPERYINSCLLQLPFYLSSTKLCEYNIIVGFTVLRQVGVDSKNNGGYNFFEVFVCNYLNILKEYIDEVSLFKWLKKDIWPFIFGYTKRLLLRKDCGNFKIENAWYILLKNYGNTWYFWCSLLCLPFSIFRIKTLKRK